MIEPRPRPPKSRPAVREPWWIRAALIGAGVSFLVVFVLVPLFTVFYEALQKGLGAYLASFNDSASIAAVNLTLVVAAIAVPANLIFGVSAAWAIAKFDFPGKSLLVTLIDLPFAVSPVVSGLIYVLIFGAHGWLGPILEEHDIKIIFAVPGIVLATIFVTFPFVARELIPVMQAQGSEEEQAALSLGANVADLLTGDNPKRPLGSGLRCNPMQRPSNGRIRRGLGCFRPHPRIDQYYTAPSRNTL
jgi:sulfate transport system permease protein